mgnify:CR=1 FL=1
MLTTFYSSHGAVAAIVANLIIKGIPFECRPISHDQCELAVHEEHKHVVGRAFTLFDQNAMVGSREESVGHPIQYLFVRSSHATSYLVEFQSGITILMTWNTALSYNVVHLAKYLRVPIKIDSFVPMSRALELRAYARDEHVGVLDHD